MTTSIWRIAQTRISHVRAETPEEAIRIALERGPLSGGTIEVTQLTGEELRAAERDLQRLTPSTFAEQAAAVKRPSGVMPAVRDTERPPIPREEPEE